MDAFIVALRTTAARARQSSPLFAARLFAAQAVRSRRHACVRSAVIWPIPPYGPPPGLSRRSPPGAANERAARVS